MKKQSFKGPAKTGFKNSSKPVLKGKTSNKFSRADVSVTKDQQNRASTDKSFYPKSWRQVAGTHAITELIQIHPKSVELVLLQANWKNSADLRALASFLQDKKIKIEEKSESQLQDICRSHQGAVAYSSRTLEFEYSQKKWAENALVIALDGVEDTHNLGAILRTSWLMGVNGMFIPEDRAVGLTAAVHKVACGGVEHVPIHRTNQFATPFETLKKAGFWVFGLSHKAEKTIYDLQMPEKVIWVLGAEDKGLRGPTEKACDELVSIPQASPQASYNVSVSAALALAETKRQWLAKRK
jgi:23S rRNA (guanosine2251-2'-O)-methyltransferase